MPNNQIVDSVGLARLLKVSTVTLAKWRRDGVIPAFRINSRTIRYDVDDVIAAIKAIQTEVAPTAGRADR